LYATLSKSFANFPSLKFNPETVFFSVDDQAHVLYPNDINMTRAWLQIIDTFEDIEDSNNPNLQLWILDKEEAIKDMKSILHWRNPNK
jgi:hypothetical protein